MTQRVLSQSHVEFTVLRPLEARWRRWDGCTLTFGYAIFAAEDRDYFVRHTTDGPGLMPPCGLRSEVQMARAA
jgi:hypothetical protein